MVAYQPVLAVSGVRSCPMEQVVRDSHRLVRNMHSPRALEIAVLPSRLESWHRLRIEVDEVKTPSARNVVGCNARGKEERISRVCMD